MPSPFSALEAVYNLLRKAPIQAERIPVKPTRDIPGALEAIRLENPQRKVLDPYGEGDLLILRAAKTPEVAHTPGESFGTHYSFFDNRDQLGDILGRRGFKRAVIAPRLVPSGEAYLYPSDLDAENVSDFLAHFVGDEFLSLARKIDRVPPGTDPVRDALEILSSRGVNRVVYPNEVEYSHSLGVPEIPEDIINPSITVLK